MAILTARPRTVLRGLLCLALAIALPAASSAQAPRVDEYRLKAAIIYNLAKFVEWPASAFADAASPFTVCVLGTDPFGPALEGATQGHSIAGRPIVTRRLIAVESGCHVVFVSSSEARRLPLVLQWLHGQSVLSIGDDPAFLEQGGMVAFARQGDRVRFSIRNDAVEQARLRMSARVLALAVPYRAEGVAP